MRNKIIKEHIKSGKLIPLSKLMEATYRDPERRAIYEKVSKEIDEENDRLLRQDVAKQIRKARLDAQITQDQLASKLKTKKSYISAIENGKQNISVEYFVKIAKALNKQIRVEMY